MTERKCYSMLKDYPEVLTVPEAAKVVPLDRLLVETDAPYLAPVPYRGKRNKSCYAYATCARLAELHGVSTEEMVQITRENALRFFKMLQK